jgi:hypothetical protein
MQSGVGALLQVWRHTCRDAGGSLVVPDGCLDLIGVQRPGHAPNWKISTLMDRAERVGASAETRYVGYRLKAGTHINVGRLLEATRGLDLDEEPRVMDRLEAMVRRDPRVAEALQTLSEARSVRAARGERAKPSALAAIGGWPATGLLETPGPAAPDRMRARRQRPAGTFRPPSWLRRSGPYEPGVSPLAGADAQAGSKATRSAQTADRARSWHTTRTLLISSAFRCSRTVRRACDQAPTRSDAAVC